MLVYRGMDIGTDKPGQEERRRVRHDGIDLVTPDQPFSVGDYLEHAREVFLRAREGGRTVLVVGGTGLYVKCLTQGLDRLPSADGRIRAKAEEWMKQGGIERLQEELRGRDPSRFEALADKKNPRRLIRALELAEHGAGRMASWTELPAAPLAGIRMDAEDLRRRIETRVRRMYDGGLLAEVERLAGQYPRLSGTALQAIGYAEALSVLRKELALEEAMERTAARTRQLAKRQITWFRRQARVEWVDVGPGEDAAAVAEKVSNVWKTHGPTSIHIGI
jgi:tRNA dimethylallyltransferase